MASNNDDDLIDLGNDACVPRVTVDDPTPEEQEHLLDVCPPKLEQKLSLTKRREQVLDSIDKGDILVTLGHDQVVPVRKRIDVVSSDTIKRVRNITRNLEPVIRRTSSNINEEIQDTVDYPVSADKSLQCSTAKHENETYETQEINNAFNFLAEHDDNAEDQEAETSFNHARNDNADCDRSISSMRPLIEEEDAVNCSFDIPSSNEETIDRSDEEERRDMVTRNDAQYDNVQLDNPAFESSPNSGQLAADIPIRHRSVSIDSEPRMTVTLKRHGWGDVAFKRESKRRSLQESHRKSWAEGASLNSALTNRLPGIDRSTSLEEERHCMPSTSNIDHGTSVLLTRYDCFYQHFHASSLKEKFFGHT